LNTGTNCGSQLDRFIGMAVGAQGCVLLMADPQLTDGTKVREIVLRRCRPSVQCKDIAGEPCFDAKRTWCSGVDGAHCPSRLQLGRSRVRQGDAIWKKKSGAKLCLSQTDLLLFSPLGFLRHSHRKPWRNRT
jgi:hypothetical protein